MRGRQADISITNLTKSAVPRLPFGDIKRAVLGKKYELSLVFASNAVSTKLHKRIRGKRGPADILSFPLGPKSGEIFLDPKAVRKNAAKFSTTFRKHAGFLFIHGLLHLKGYRHGSKMESKEKAFSKKFGLLN